MTKFVERQIAGDTVEPGAKCPLLRVKGARLTPEAEKRFLAHIFGDANHLTYDYFLRLSGSSNPNVIRDNPTVQQQTDWTNAGFAGVAPGKIMETRYAASPNGDASPIRLSYVAVTAMTGQCGQWPEDLSDNTFANKNWYNFGCASQSNLAAQIANPVDLVGPRGMSPIDAERRAVVIDTYRGKTSTAATD